MTSTAPSIVSSQCLSYLEKFVEEKGLPIFRGIEKEGLRANASLDISQTNHPATLGHPLTHPSITTDYSEALLELITPAESSRDKLMAELEDIHLYVQQNLGDELLWGASMPCRLDGDRSIRIAEYGSSNIGQLKHVYRQGLGVRYGRVMQSIAGLHFNFSLSDEFWQGMHALSESALSLQDFKSDKYFGLIRNFRRYSWLLMYLFGASPALDQSFVKGKKHDLEPFDNKGSLYKPYATSLRMGDLGYHNNAQASLSICFNTLDNFTTTLGHAIKTPYRPYEDIGIKQGDQFVQLNTNILQIENEYYSSIRPKRTTHSGEKPTQALIERGVEYVEVRCLDLNPFLPLGISTQQIDFMDVFLLFCLGEESPYINDQDCKTLEDNFNLTVNDGRNPALRLTHNGKPVAIKEWGSHLLESMLPVAQMLDKAKNDGRYTATLKEQQHKIAEPDLTPSAQVLSVMKQENLSWLDFAGELSNKHKKHISRQHPEKRSTPQEIHDHFATLARESLTEAASIECNDTVSFEEFLSHYQEQ